MTVDDLIEDAKRRTFDLTKDEDLSLAVMNLVSLEEHAYFTAMKTGKDEYLDLLATLREKRTELLALLVREPEGEVWCMSKHLLSTTMRLIETGNKFRPQDAQLAKGLYEHAWDLYALFWLLNDQDSASTGPASGPAAGKSARPAREEQSAQSSLLAKAKVLVRRAVDCCIER